MTLQRPRRRWLARPATRRGSEGGAGVRRSTHVGDAIAGSLRHRGDGARGLLRGRVRHAKGGKAGFDHIYDQPDPRMYARALRGVGYEIPDHAARVFARLVDARRAQRDGRDPVVLDLCCSYGITAALLNHDLGLEALFARYASREIAALSTEELVSADRAFFAEHRRAQAVPIVGIDVARNALAYAQRVGLHRLSSSDNLEEQDPGDELAEALEDVSLVTVTGGVGYISARTFDRVLERADEGCWIAAFALRWTDYEPIAAALARHGLTTERLSPHTFPQRRFVDRGERAYAMGEVRTRGLNPEGRESTGWYHANLYLSRPASDPGPELATLLAGCLGAEAPERPVRSRLLRRGRVRARP